MQRKEIYEGVIRSFEDKYSFLGKQVAEEALLSIASWNIQEFSEPDFRIRRHLLLFWQPGWMKSSLLKKIHQLIGEDNCTFMSDITNAALRGTVESGKFISPFTLKKPFSVCTEFGQVIGGSDTDDIFQKLLNVLEEGIVTVSLSKIAQLSPIDREEIAKRYPVTFLDNNTFTYETNWILMAGTYNKKFLVDNAFQSRFNIVHPTKPLDSALVKHVIRSPPYELDEEVAINLRYELIENKTIDTTLALPDELFDEVPSLSMRESAQLISEVLCRNWWGIKMSKDELIEKAKYVEQQREQIWLTAEDRVFASIETEAKNIEEIMEETKLSRRGVFYALKKLRPVRSTTGDNMVYKIM